MIDHPPTNTDPRPLPIDSRSDLALIRQAIKQDWPIRDEVKAPTVEALRVALEDAVQRGRIRHIAAIAKTLAVIKAAS